MKLQSRWTDWIGMDCVSVSGNVANVRCWIRWWHPRAWALLAGMFLLAVSGIRCAIEGPARRTGP